MMPVPAALWREIPEGDANPRVAELYAEIRRCLDTSHVPTLYRVVAAHGYLEEFWDILRPVVMSPDADRFVERARQIGGDLAERLGGARIELDDDVRPHVMGVLESFNRGNPRNFLFSTAGRRLFPFETATAGTWKLAPEADESAVPELETVWVEIRVAHGGVAIPGFYRALGKWPDALKLTWSAAKPMLAAPELEKARAQLTHECRAIVEAHPACAARSSPAAHELARMLDWFVWANPTAILEIEYLRAHISESAAAPSP